MLNIDHYVNGLIKYNYLICKVISGRQVCFNSIINPIRHRTYFLQADSPMVTMAIREVHHKIGCGLGVQSYVNNIQLVGITAPSIHRSVKNSEMVVMGAFNITCFLMQEVRFQKQIGKNRGLMIYYRQL